MSSRPVTVLSCGRTQGAPEHVSTLHRRLPILKGKGVSVNTASSLPACAHAQTPRVSGHQRVRRGSFKAAPVRESGRVSPGGDPKAGGPAASMLGEGPGPPTCRHLTHTPAGVSAALLDAEGKCQADFIDVLYFSPHKKFILNSGRSVFFFNIFY